MAGYVALLQRSIARSELARVGLTAELKINPQPAAPAVLRAEARRSDPLQLADGSLYRVASRLEARFVQPRFDGSADRSYSCLLYGPPGTGKTTLARRLAGSLNWPLINITISDFIAGGEAQVEARTKKVFEALSAQREAVIFFDQIDELLHDRDTPAHERQAGMLHFMTPSMLTKINDLRQSERVVFVVGTASPIDGRLGRTE